MKITDELTLSLDKIFIAHLRGSGLENDEHELMIHGNITPEKTCFAISDKEQGEGFCKNLKAKIDAYFEAKEDIVIYQAARLNPGHHDVEKYYEDEI